jgi:hypothetical protein
MENTRTTVYGEGIILLGLICSAIGLPFVIDMIKFLISGNEFTVPLDGLLATFFSISALGGFVLIMLGIILTIQQHRLESKRKKYNEPINQ